MGIEEMKSLAKKKAMQVRTPTKSRTFAKGDTDIDYNDEPDYKIELDTPERVGEYEKAKDKEESLSDLGKAKDPMEDDHATKNPRVKQMRKFHMMKSLLGIMDEMD